MNDEHRPFVAELRDYSNECVAAQIEAQLDLCRRAEWVGGLAAWDVAATATFRYRCGIWAAEKAWLGFMRRHFPEVRYFYAVEIHPGGHGAHVHALLEYRRRQRKHAWRVWFERYGRALFSGMRSRRNACAYAAKHLLKQRNCQEDFHWGFGPQRLFHGEFQTEFKNV